MFTAGQTDLSCLPLMPPTKKRGENGHMTKAKPQAALALSQSSHSNNPSRDSDEGNLEKKHLPVKKESL